MMSISRSVRLLAGLFLAVILSVAACGRNEVPPTNQTYDLKITNATIIDGTGASSFQGSVLVHDGIIQYVGKHSLSRHRASEEIDAAGRVVSPGFIDAHAHGNAEMNPLFRNFWSMGVTTIALGMDGRSPGIDDLEGWIERVEEARPAVNIVHFVGHGTAREHSGIGLRTEVSADDLYELVNLISSQLAAGSFGVSTGLEYIPGRFAERTELALVAEIVARYDGLIMSHIRNEDDNAVAASVRELIQMGRDGGARVHVSHIKIVYSRDPLDATYILYLMAEARDTGLEITADVYPYNASYTGIGIVYPDFALPPNDFEQVRREKREQLASHLRVRINQRNGPEATLFGTQPWTGRTLAEIADEKGIPFEDVLIDYIPPGSASAAYFVMDLDVMRTFLSNPYVMISSDGSPNMLHPRGYGSFAKIIRRFVVEEELLSLEEAIYKMTGLTAETLHLVHDRTPDHKSGTPDPRFIPRGYLKPGFGADILIFDPNQVRDTATFEHPHQFAIGFDYVIVNGESVQAHGEPAGPRPGVVLRSR